MNPVAVNGPTLTIKGKFPSEAITMEQLIRIGSVTDEAANFLKKLVAAKYNIFVKWWNRSRKDNFPECVVELYTKRRTPDHNRG